MNKILLGALSLAVAMSLNAKVFATVDGKDITDIDLAPLLANMPGINPDSLPENVKKDLINRAVDIKLLTDKAIASGIEKDELYKKEIKLAQRALALRVWQAKEFQKLKVSDSDIKAFYDKNKEKFIEPEQISAKHILVKDDAEAKKIISQLKGLKGDALSKKFSELAAAESLDPSGKQTGGDLGWFSVNQMVKPFSDAAKALKKGEISTTPVKTQFGSHVILKLDQKAKRQATLEEVKPYIENILKQDKFKANVEKEAENLRKKAKVEYK
ncbi:peptidylprolyl isomerase [Campylobacter geochelonis]|uniref:Foldase protein PrsA n=1 Tax=Campylobacter geochelonis TaxID=1780362 RepID=A0A128EEC2_9BACT|nr:peptidylprolyl isomerase [Campylobacter geochelonis]QKF71082.1 major antigenic peptide / PpiC-type peptidyl-prolyl cis-trans isomerase [Campylobacter geochelonis]CZE47275.1 foldase protein PrsA [Campylobacter geochelonis]CZE48408.1 foldase protein PrsA [Campylobacter geochelonis]CZE50102.1 foldase protein PrsA [Campylobacter geochelonis]